MEGNNRQVKSQMAKVKSEKREDILEENKMEDTPENAMILIVIVLAGIVGFAVGLALGINL